MEKSKQLRGEFVFQLLNANTRNEELLYRQAGLIGLDLYQTYMVGVIKLGNMDKMSTDIDKSILKIISGDLLNWNNKLFTAEEGQEALVAFIPAGLRKNLNDFITVVNNVLNYHSANNLQAVIGIGRVCNNIYEFKISHQQAHQALKIGKALKLQQQLLIYQELGSYALLSQIDRSDAEETVQTYLGILLEYDSKHRSELVNSLETFLEQGGNFKNTATFLHVHFNTLRYRLQHIEELTGLDLASPAIRFELQIALRLFKLGANG